MSGFNFLAHNEIEQKLATLHLSNQVAYTPQDNELII